MGWRGGWRVHLSFPPPKKNRLLRTSVIIELLH